MKEPARRPENRLINDFAVLQATVRKLATVIGYLSLTWSTVVLLGGFVSELPLADFWTITALSTALALKHSCGVVCLVVICTAIAATCLGVLLIGYLAVLQTVPFAPVGAIAVSWYRLVAMTTSYGDNAAKLKASLRIFYSISLVQNVLFLLWSLFFFFEDYRAEAVRQECEIGEWGSRLLDRYVRETRSMCATEGALPLGRNLITFAVGLLGSKSLYDHRDAVHLLDELVEKEGEVGPRFLHYISEDGIEKLIKALEVGNDGETRYRAARIVLALAGNLRHIDQFPTALDHIGSLLQASDGKSHGNFPEATETWTEEDEVERKRRRKRKGPVYWCVLSLFNRHIRERSEDWTMYEINEKPYLLISRSLLIIERLALHQGNCVHICNNHLLLSKITAPLYSHTLLNMVEYNNSKLIDHIERSLRIVARLIKTPGEAGRGLRDGMASNTQAISNLTGVLEDNKFGPIVKTSAIDILAQLVSSSHNSATALLDIKRFISQLWGIFLDERDDIYINRIIEAPWVQEARQKAGEALAQMLSVWDAATSSSDILEMFVQSTTPYVMKYKDGGSSSEEVPTAALRHVVGQLTDILIKSKGPRTMAARILECLCSRLSTKHRELLRQDVIELLTEVLELILHIRCIEGSHLLVQVQEEKDFLVALLSLAVAICDRMVDAHDFTCAAPQDMVLLVNRLKRIIRTNIKPTVECLRTVKLTCQLVVSMVHLKPIYMKDLIDQNFEDAVESVLNIWNGLCDLDNCLMLFDVDDHNQVTKTDKPLVAIVKHALELFRKAQEPSNVLA